LFFEHEANEEEETSMPIQNASVQEPGACMAIQLVLSPQEALTLFERTTIYLYDVERNAGGWVGPSERAYQRFVDGDPSLLCLFQVGELAQAVLRDSTARTIGEYYWRDVLRQRTGAVICRATLARVQQHVALVASWVSYSDADVIQVVRPADWRPGMSARALVNAFRRAGTSAEAVMVRAGTFGVVEEVSADPSSTVGLRFGEVLCHGGPEDVVAFAPLALPPLAPVETRGHEARSCYQECGATPHARPTGICAEGTLSCLICGLGRSVVLHGTQEERERKVCRLLSMECPACVSDQLLLTPAPLLV
jgi:hypothetical protein